MKSPHTQRLELTEDVYHGYELKPGRGVQLSILVSCASSGSPIIERWSDKSAHESAGMFLNRYEGIGVGVGLATGLSANGYYRSVGVDYSFVGSGTAFPELGAVSLALSSGEAYWNSFGVGRCRPDLLPAGAPPGPDWGYSPARLPSPLLFTPYSPRFYRVFDAVYQNQCWAEISSSLRLKGSGCGRVRFEVELLRAEYQEGTVGSNGGVRMVCPRGPDGRPTDNYFVRTRASVWDTKVAEPFFHTFTPWPPGDMDFERTMPGYLQFCAGDPVISLGAFGFPTEAGRQVEFQIDCVEARYV